MYISHHPTHIRRRRIAGGIMVIVLLELLGLWAVHTNVVQAAQEKPHPVPAGVHCQGEAACQRAVAWQKHQKVKRLRAYYQPAVLPALRIAAALYPVPLSELVTVADCETGHTFDPNAGAGSAHEGLFQLSAWHRSFAVVQLLGWRSALAQALHTASFVSRHGWGQWQCREDGRGLRW